MNAVEELSEALILLESAEEVRDFLTDLFTPEEIEGFAVRWRVMSLLAKGNRPIEVHKATKVSRTTVARARRVVKHGTGVIEKLVSRLSGHC